jgi:hypothetical protein
MSNRFPNANEFLVCPLKNLHLKDFRSRRKEKAEKSKCGRNCERNRFSHGLSFREKPKWFFSPPRGGRRYLISTLASALFRKPTTRVKVRAANMTRNHSLDRKRASNACRPILRRIAESETANASGCQPRCWSSRNSSLHPPDRRVSSPKKYRSTEGDGIHGSDADRLQPAVQHSPMNAGRRPSQGKYRGDISSSTRKRHCDGTPPKENFRRANTFRTSSDLSGDHGWTFYSVISQSWKYDSHVRVTSKDSKDCFYIYHL